MASGRVWDGASAFDLGLADQLGSLEDAVAVAAKMVNLSPHQAAYVQEELNPMEQFLRNLHSARIALTVSKDPLLARAHQVFNRLAGQYNFLLSKDPKQMYSHCLLPFSLLLF